MIVEQFELIVNAPVTTVFEFISKPINMLALIPPRALLKYQDIWSDPDGNYGYSMVYQFMRIKVETKSYTTEVIPERKMVIRTEGQLNGIAIWELTPENESTRISIRFEYDEPAGVLVQVARKFTETVLKDTLSKIVANLIRLFGERK